MIQFNLLPDVKLEYVRARNRKRLIIGTSIVVSAVFFGLFLLLFLFVKVNQAKYISDLTKDINTNVKKIQSKEDLDKILTIQNQLSSLPALHDQKVVSSRLLDYLTQLLPTQSTITTISVDFAANSIELQGEADNLGTVNKFVDTLKFTDYKVNTGDEKTGKAFSNVVLDSFSVEKPAGAGQGGKATYSLKFSFDPVIFQNVKGDVPDGKQPVTLTVPNIISTRSETEKPAALFSPQTQNVPGQGQ
jgi:Tfp pilus assembly protein PilN